MQNQKLRTTLTETQAQVSSMRNDLAGLRSGVIQHSRILKAVISLLGEESVKAEVERMDAEEQAQQEAQQAEGIKAMVDQGILVTTDLVGVKSFLVGTDTFDAVPGQPTRRPQRVQFELAQVKADLQANYLGKKVGDTVEAGPGGKFTINEVYNIDVVKAVQVAQAAQAAQQQGQQQPPAPATPAESEPTPAPAPESPAEAPQA